MKLLAWDTSSKVGVLAALEWDERQASLGKYGVRLVAEWTLNIDATHSERLLWAIDLVLKAANWTLDDVDVLAVGVGPGSFTGLRIGLTTARTLAQALNKPVVGVSSLTVLARPAALWLAQQKERVVVAAVTDACKGELFALCGSARSVVDCVSFSQGDRAGLWKRGVEEQVLTPDALVKMIKKKLTEGGRQQAAKSRWYVLGEGRSRYPEIWKQLPSSKEWKTSVPFSDHLQGRFLGLLAWEAYQAGLAKSALELHPRYLRASDAELKLKAGLLPPCPSRS